MLGKTAAAAACAVAAALVAAGAALAEPPVTASPTLAGEKLAGGAPTLVSANCNENGTSTFTETSTGIATGPYPGTYTATLTATIGPQTVPAPFAPSTVNYGPVLQVQETFTIVSGTTTIHGTKTLFTGPGYQFPATQHGVCDDVAGHAPPTMQAFCTDFVFFNSDAPLLYSATLEGPTGTTHDHGTSYTATGGISATCGGAPFASGAFNETFFASAVPIGVTLTPAADTNPVGTQHTVTAFVRDSTLQPAEGQTVVFNVSGATTATGSCTTGADGTCTFTYTGPLFPGADTIRAFVDRNGNGIADPGEPTGIAFKAWVLPASTPGQATGGGKVPGATFGFNAKSDAKGIKGACNVVDDVTGVHVKCLDVSTYAQTGNSATFYGTADVDGVTQRYVITVTDNGEAGTADHFRIATSGGYTAGGVLTSGNVQVH